MSVTTLTYSLRQLWQAFSLTVITLKSILLQCWHMYPHISDKLTLIIQTYLHSQVICLLWVLATGAGNRLAVQAWTATTDKFTSRNVQNLDRLHLGGPNLDPCPLMCRFYWVWLDPSVPISGSVLRVVLFIVIFRYPTAYRKILTLLCHCPFQMNRLPL